MNVHQLIDKFVACGAHRNGIFQPIEDAPWITELEQRLPKRLPVSFRSLVTRYSFAVFESGELAFFANMGTDDMDEMRVAIFEDRFIAQATLRSGYVQFARPAGGSYDPVCFDATRPVNNREFPIVRLDHEEILCNDRIHVSEKIADSFFRFAEEIVRSA
jgi:hypothetical protein